MKFSDGLLRRSRRIVWDVEEESHRNASRYNLSCVAMAGSACLQIITAVQSACTSSFELARACALLIPRPVSVGDGTRRDTAARARRCPALVPPRNFLHTTSTVRSNFRDTYNWFPDTAVRREWESTRCADYERGERQIAGTRTRVLVGNGRPTSGTTCMSQP